MFPILTWEREIVTCRLLIAFYFCFESCLNVKLFEKFNSTISLELLIFNLEYIFLLCFVFCFFMILYEMIHRDLILLRVPVSLRWEVPLATQWINILDDASDRFVVLLLLLNNMLVRTSPKVKVPLLL